MSKADHIPKGGIMRRKLGGIIAILVATLAVGLGTVAGTVHAAGPQAGHHILAEDQGPTIGTP